MLIYLDLCCFNRPFDKQDQLLVRLQTEAKLEVQQAIRDGSLTLAWSAVLDLENQANPDAERREAIAAWRGLAAIDVDATGEVEAGAVELALRGVKPMDALHVASAVSAGAAWMLTTDRTLIRKMHGDPRIRVADPLDFIRAFEENTGED